MQHSNGCGRRHGLRATAVLLSLLASTSLVQAQSATWIGTAGPPNNWNTAANWAPTSAGPPAFVPTVTAFFDLSLLTTTTIDIGGGTTVGGMTFTNAPGYTFTLPGLFVLNGAGVSVDAGSVAPTFSIGAGGTFGLANSATAGRSIIDVNGGQLAFVNTSSAGSAIVTNSGTINFGDASNGGTATIFNNAGAFLNFNFAGGMLSASAGSATIDNSGVTVFYNSSTAGNSTLTTRFGATTVFLNNSNAGASQQNVLGTLNFVNGSNAGSSTITNSGTVNFNDTSNAGSSHIVNNTGGFVFFNQAGAGSASAANSTITNSGNLGFFSASTAANATIITQAGGVTVFNGQATGGTTSLVINSNGVGFGTVNISTITDPSFIIGSLAGNTGPAPFAQFLIGAKSLIVGTNNTSTSYGGVLLDFRRRRQPDQGWEPARSPSPASRLTREPRPYWTAP